MKKIFLALPIVALLAAGCNSSSTSQPTSEQTKPTQQTQQQQQATQTPPVNETQNWKTYTNSMFGFQLTFTDAWKGYKVFSSEGSQGVGAPTYLEFSLPTTDKSRNVINVTDEVSGYAAPLTITIIAKDRNYQGTGVKITQDNDNAYYYTIDNDLPNDLKQVNFEIPKIISTFKFSGATSQNQTSNWKTYTSDDLGFSLQYPNDTMPIDELNDQYNRLVGFGKNKNDSYFEFEVELIKDSNLMSNGFLGSEVEPGSVKVGSIFWFKSVSVTGYGDAGAQTPPFVAFSVKHNGDIYFIVFYGDAKMSSKENQILSSFKFTK